MNMIDDLKKVYEEFAKYRVGTILLKYIKLERQ